MGGPKTVLLLVLFSLNSAIAIIDYCRNHTFDRPSNMEILHFSKENSEMEFGIFDKFKCLHCCSHGYRSIEWFKDGRPYPWPTDISTLIIHPQSNNQTICSQQSTPFDSGKYWCIARNDTHFLRHEVLLQISGPSISMGWPRTTYRPRDQKADRGESVRFYCEAFVGTIDLPDFQSEIAWERYDLNQSFIDGERVVQEVVFREEKRILGSYLHFNKIISEDYGEYTCKVRNLGDQVVRLSAWLKNKEVTPPLVTKVRQYWMFFFLLCLLILIATITSICLLKYGFSRILRNRISHESDNFVGNGQQEKDVLVIYHKNDEKETLRVMSAIQKTVFCTYSLHPLESRCQIGEDELKIKANSYRVVLAVMSNSLLEGAWSCESVRLFIQGLLSIHFTIACLFLQALPSPNLDTHEWDLLKECLGKVYYIDKSNGNTWKIVDLFKQRFSFERKDFALRGSWQNLI